MQIADDEARGFAVRFESERDLLGQLTKDTVGLVGEIGEFSNIIKRVVLKQDHPQYVGPTLNEAAPQLREELADTVIYILRLAALLETDLESDVLKKIAFNRTRYEHLEQK
jgi:NTP pyrophosphatase (non-canonical NTP hydrolase)